MAKVTLGNEALVGSLIPSNAKTYRVTNKIKVGDEPLYALVFNFLDSRFFNVFATASGNKINVYDLGGGGDVTALQSYTDEDEEESFYTLSWARGDDGKPFLVAAGLKGIVRVIDIYNEKIHKSLLGHGGDVHEIRTHHVIPKLVITASKDESVRLWNIETGVCIMLFSGEGGHREDVLSVDFHPTDMYIFASSGMDTTVKIWSMKENWAEVEKSFTWTGDMAGFPIKRVLYPVFSTSVHTSYVDCNRWLGDFFLSKSVEDEILLWEPKPGAPGEGTSDVLLIYPNPLCEIWCMKFSTDLNLNSFAIGNKCGDILVWDLKTCPPVLITKLSHRRSNSVIRQTAMSENGSTILACTENGSLWRWDEVIDGDAGSDSDCSTVLSF